MCCIYMIKTSVFLGKKAFNRKPGKCGIYIYIYMWVLFHSSSSVPCRSAGTLWLMLAHWLQLPLRWCSSRFFGPTSGSQCTGPMSACADQPSNSSEFTSGNYTLWWTVVYWCSIIFPRRCAGDDVSWSSAASISASKSGQGYTLGQMPEARMQTCSPSPHFPWWKNSRTACASL